MKEENDENYNLLHGKIMASAPPGEEIVISGVAGTFPNSDNVYHFQENLFSKVNMVLPNRRWDYSHPEMPLCSGTIPIADKYDAGFFGVHRKQGDGQDALSRNLLEKTVEALFDAGLNLEDIAGTCTGVYVGSCFSETERVTMFDGIGTERKYGFAGSTRSSYAHRISYFFKLKGPSFISDTACSSSFFALDNAFRDLRLGIVDNAILCGANMCFHPFVTLQFARLGVLSMDGCCKVFDQTGDGYARSEAIGVMILQKSKVAKRKYAEIIYVKTNCDGFKEESITYPSGEAQRDLLTEFYKESQIPPESLSFLEAHGTGTSVGDPEECTSIDDVLAKCRKDPLLVGSVKSNIGHSEPASGICAITKCIIGFETGYIPPNIHFTTPRKDILGLIEGRMEVVTEKIPFKDNRGLIGINSFGFGGGNCHVLLKSNNKEKINNGIPDDDIPRLTCFSGRTEESMVILLDELKSSTLDAERVRLLHDVFRNNIPNHLYRGYSLKSKSGEICRFFKKYSGTQATLYFVFGDLVEWYELGKKLMGLSAFASTIEKAQQILQPQGINIFDNLFGKVEEKSTNQILGSILVQMGVIHIFRDMKIQPTNCFGYSFGEFLAAYFDRSLTFKQTVECAFVIDNIIDKVNYLHETKDLSQVNGYIVNGNARNNSATEIFGTIFKYPEFLPLKKELLANLSNILSTPKTKNSEKTSTNRSGSADYFISAINKPFSEHVDSIKKKSIILNFGAVSVSDINIEDVKILPLVPSKDGDYLVGFLKILGNLYVNGYNPQLHKLYPDITFPVSKGTRMISPFIKWNHDRSYFIPSYKLELLQSAQCSSRRVKIRVQDKEWSFVRGHVIDGRNLFPATGYLYLAWETLSIIKDYPIAYEDAIFENVKFMRATTLPKKGVLRFDVSVNKFSGNFEILEGGSPVVTGQVFTRMSKSDAYNDVTEIVKDSHNLTSKDVYKELRLRGYNYSGGFRNIKEFNRNDYSGLVKWDDNWITFLDNLLQLKIFTTDSRLLYVPTNISHITIPASSFMAWIRNSFTTKEREPLIPAYINQHSGDIRCGNIIIKGLIATSISRKRDLGIPVLEKYQFVPNVTKLELNDSIRVNMQIFLENALIRKIKCVELIDDCSKGDILLPVIQSALEDQPLIQPVVKIISKMNLENIPEHIPVEEKELASETDCNLIIGSRLLDRPTVLKAALGPLKDNGFIISRETLNLVASPLEVEDFTIFTIHETPEETVVLLKKNSKTKELITINVSSSDDFSWIAPLKDIIKTKQSDNVLLYSQNQPTNGVLGLVNCLKREPESSYIRCLLILDDADDFDKENPFYKEQLDKNMAINIWKDNVWGSYRHLPLKTLDNVQSEHCYVNTTVRGDLSSLRWIESTLRSGMIVPPEKTLVTVHYAALNFRDVMTASGRINADVITQDRIEQECVQGFEFSGYTQGGDRVMGLVTNGALSTMILADHYLLFKVPESISLKEAATIPVVYGTVIYGMVLRARLKEGDSVLIHSGTGGVGQAAIRVALHYKCNIFTTVGTSEKREYLLKTFPAIKSHQIGNSRDISFEKMVKKYTSNRGVDVILNSLAEEKLIASVRCLATGGRFLEIGKFDLANNKELNLLLLKKEASFHGVMLDALIDCSPAIKKQVADILSSNIGNYIVPLPATCFGYSQIEDAFRHMSTGKHMGKVIVQVRENERIFKERSEKFVGIPRYFCYPEKSYIIVGGLGGFGLELADWLVLRGAKNLVLTSRKGISTGYQKMRIQVWESYGVIVHISKEDVCTEDGCRNLLQEAKKLGNVHTIFNLAVVLADAIFENQTEETFKTSFGPKAVATKHLDKVSRVLCPDLKAFVIFSSVTCGRGNPGQTNYGMANSVVERICERRKKDGYPALAIQWGAIGDVGLVAELQEEHFQLEIGGTLQQKISNCLNVLNTFLRQKEATVLSSMVVAEKRGGLGSCDNVVDTVISILGLPDSKLVSHHTTLPELGMDSMTAVEIKQTLEREFEIFLSPSDMKTMTLAKLKKIQEDKCLSVEGDRKIDMTDMLLTEIGDEEEIKLVEVKLQSKLSDNAIGPNVFLFPGIEGFAKKFNTLAKQLDAHVMAYQYWDNLKYQSVQEIAQSLLPKVEQHLTQNQRFNLVGYSFGSLVASEIAHLLESKGHIGNLVFVDGGTLLMKQMLKTAKEESDKVFETLIICRLLSFIFPATTIPEHQIKLLKCNTFKERSDLGAEIAKSVITSEEKLAHQRALGHAFYNRIGLIETYSQSYEKLKSKITLFKPSIPVLTNIENDYDLAKISESEVEMIVFDGNHATVVENVLLGQAINSIIQQTTN